MHFTASKRIKYLHLIQYNTQLWTSDQMKFFTLSGRIFDIEQVLQETLLCISEEGTPLPGEEAGPVKIPLSRGS